MLSIIDMDKIDCDYCLSPELNCNLTRTHFLLPHMDLYDKREYESLYNVYYVFCTIVPVLFSFATARVLPQLWHHIAYSDSILRFLLEFAAIVPTTILSISIFNEKVEYFVGGLIAFLLCIIVLKIDVLRKGIKRNYELGRRPHMLTLVRASINFLTALCILAIDFDSFPKEFRKSRNFGAGLMDVGIGLFVFSMGTVSSRVSKASDLLRTVGPVLFLGLTRTLIIININYHQDEHEYGSHLNAFFTLGLTKFFGTLLCFITTKDSQLLPLGLGVLLIHETVLQLGVAEFVMDEIIERTTFWTANREGIFSLPGFIAVYIISMYIGHCLQSITIMNLDEFLKKIKNMTLVSICTWLLVVVLTLSVGISRVTCNLGYAVWILGIAITMTLLFLIVFELLLNTIWPVYVNGKFTLLNDSSNSIQQCFPIPILVEAINRNGLSFFLLANVLTGCVNIFLRPEELSIFHTFLILTAYMLINTGFVYVLHRFKIRIA